MDKTLIPVMDKVKVDANEEFESLFPKFQPSQVTITTTSGQKHTKRVDVPEGDPRNPMTAEEIGVTLHALGNSAIGRGRCDRLAGSILAIETLAEVRQLLGQTTRG